MLVELQEEQGALWVGQLEAWPWEQVSRILFCDLYGLGNTDTQQEQGHGPALRDLRFSCTHIC